MIPLDTFALRRTEGKRLLPRGGKGGYLNQRSATHKHRGIDMGAPIGAPVRAAMGGTVTHASDVWAQGFTGYGRHVVTHNADGTYSLYAHLDTVGVSPGDIIPAGHPLGTVGNTLFTRDDKEGAFKRSGPHLHFEAASSRYPKRAEADRIDPVAWLEYAENYGGEAVLDAPLDDGNIPDDSPDLDVDALRAEMEAARGRLQNADTDGGNFIASLALFGAAMWLLRGAS